MFAFFTDWGSGQKLAVVVTIAIVLLLLAFVIWDSGAGLGESVKGLILVLILIAFALLAISYNDKGRREGREIRHALEKYDWKVLHASWISEVQIGDCIVDLQLEKLDGDNSLFAIGNEPDAHHLSEIHPEVVELCS